MAAEEMSKNMARLTLRAVGRYARFNPRDIFRIAQKYLKC